MHDRYCTARTGVILAPWCGHVESFGFVTEQDALPLFGSDQCHGQAYGAMAALCSSTPVTEQEYCAMCSAVRIPAEHSDEPRILSIRQNSANNVSRIEMQEIRYG